MTRSAIGATGKAGRKPDPASAVIAARTTEEEAKSTSGSSQVLDPRRAIGIAPRVGRS